MHNVCFTGPCQRRPRVLQRVKWNGLKIVGDFVNATVPIYVYIYSDVWSKCVPHHHQSLLFGRMGTALIIGSDDLAMDAAASAKISCTSASALLSAGGGEARPMPSRASASQGRADGLAPLSSPQRFGICDQLTAHVYGDDAAQLPAACCQFWRVAGVLIGVAVRPKVSSCAIQLRLY